MIRSTVAKWNRDIIIEMIGTKVLEERKSKYNGNLRVVKTWGMGTYIQSNGITQSGGIVEAIWKQTLKHVAGSKKHVANALILGLGGGTAIKLIHKNWPKAKITGVDIDPIMIELGKKYLGLSESLVKIIIQDAGKSVPGKFDLVIVDLYQGDKFPKKFETENYIHLVRTILSRSGLAVFNRLYFKGKKEEALEFGKKLEKVFDNVEWYYPEANLMFLCYNRERC